MLGSTAIDRKEAPLPAIKISDYEPCFSMKAHFTPVDSSNWTNFECESIVRFLLSCPSLSYHYCPYRRGIDGWIYSFISKILRERCRSCVLEEAFASHFRPNYWSFESRVGIENFEEELQEIFFNLKKKFRGKHAELFFNKCSHLYNRSY